MPHWPSAARHRPVRFLALLLLLPGTARAGGFTIPLVGARMLGQAAFTTHPDDTTTIYHNPAGLLLLPALRADVSGTGILAGTYYDRIDYPQLGTSGEFDTSRAPGGACPDEGAAAGYDAQGFVREPCFRPTVEPESRFGVIPFAGVAAPLGDLPVALGVGLYSPHNATAAFPANGAQRYQVIDGSITTVYVTPTLALRAHPSLLVGLGFSYIRANASLRRAFWLPAGLNPEEIVIDLDSTGTAYGYNTGLIFLPGELAPSLAGLELSLGYTSAADLRFQGDIRVLGAGPLLGPLFEPDFQEGQAITRAATAEFTVPDTVRAGIGYALGEVFWIGLDLYYNRYSLYDELTIRLREPLGSLQEFAERKDSFDCWSLGTGVRVTPQPFWDLRAGFFYDGSPYPDRTFSILSPDSDKRGVTGGLSLRIVAGLELSLGYMALWFVDRQVSDSDLRPGFTLGGAEFRAPFSGNGEVVDKLVHIGAVQLSYTGAASPQAAD